MRCISSIQCGFILVLSALLFRFAKCNSSNLTSPCPRFFTYENNTEAEDRWYGAITLLSEHDLNGVWLRIVFDKPVVQIRSTFGEAIPREGNEYLIKDHNFKLVQKISHTVRFYVQYAIPETPANLIGFRLNGRIVCPEADLKDTTTERLFTSWKLDEHAVLENIDGSNTTFTNGTEGYLYTASANTNTSKVAIESISLSSENSTRADRTNNTPNGTLFTSDNDYSTNTVESNRLEEQGTLYVSN